MGRATAIRTDTLSGFSCKKGDILVSPEDNYLESLAPGASGTVLTSNGTGAVPSYQAAGGSSKCVISGQSAHWNNLFGPGFLPLNASYGQATTSAASDFSSITSAPWVAPVAGTLKNFYVAEDIAPTGGHDTISVYKNGTITTLAVTITNTATTGIDTTHTVSVAAGDKFYIGGTADSTDNGTAGTWSLEFDPS